LDGATAKRLSGRILTAPAMNAHNTFDHPDAVKPTAFSAFEATAKGFSATLPPESVVMIAVE
jgi:alpha-N-arabinofuranosidase